MRLLVLALLVACGEAPSVDSAEETAEIEGYPDISVDAATLDFGELPPGSQASLALPIWNQGTGYLEISSFSTDDPVFYPSTPGPITVIPGIGFQLLVFCTAPTDDAHHAGKLTLESNDPEEQVVIVGLACAPAPDTGDTGG